MNVWRAIGFGALFWILIFFEITALLLGFGLEKNLNYYIIHYAVMILLLILCAFLYFKSEEGGVWPGFLLGFTFIITGVVFDALISIPLFTQDYMFFYDPFLWLGYLVMLVVPAIIGLMKQ